MDGHGKPFAHYSNGYARLKSIETGSATPVNLQLTGAMLAAIEVSQADRYGVVISCDDEKAEWHNAGEGHNPQREFLAITQADRTWVSNQVLRYQALAYLQHSNESGAP